MCGRGGVAGVATMTSQQFCVGSAGRRPPQALKNGLQALRRQAGRKTEGPKVRRQKIRTFRPELGPWRRRKGKEPKEDKAFRPGEKAAWRKNVERTWTLRTRSRVAKSWMSKKGSCRRSCEILKSSRVCRKSFRKASRVTCSSNCKRSSKGGTTSCQSTRRCRRGHRRHKVSRIEGEIRKKMWQRRKRCGSSEMMSSRKRCVSFFSVGQSREEQDGRCRNGSRTSGVAGR